MHAQSIENEHGDRNGADITRQSVVMYSLNEASAKPLIALSLIGHLFNQIERLTETAVQKDESDADSESSGDDSKNKEQNSLEETEDLAAPPSIDSQASSTAGDEADNEIDPDSMDMDVQNGISDSMEEDDESEMVPDGPTDLGRFVLQDVCCALAVGELDEPRLIRLRVGFLDLLHQSR